MRVGPPNHGQAAHVDEGRVVSTADGKAFCEFLAEPRQDAFDLITGTGSYGFILPRESFLLPMAVDDVEAAKIIGFSPSFLREGRSKGVRPNHTTGPPYVKRGRAVRYLVSDLLEWLEQGRVVLEDPEQNCARSV